MGEPNPIDDEDLYNAITLAGVRSPGKVTLSGHDRKVGWDVHNAAGQSGSTITLKEIPAIEFTATFYLVQDIAQGIDDFAAWPAFRELINSTVTPGKMTAGGSLSPSYLADVNAQRDRADALAPAEKAARLRDLSAQVAAAQAAVAPKPSAAFRALDIYHPDLAANDIKSVLKGLIGGVVHDGKGGQTIVVKFQEYRPPVAIGGSPSGSKTSSHATDPNAAANAELERLTAQYQATPWG